ncbi:hypothetical protein DSM101010T_04250 [Desulfovibrio subterraneus]|uniref:Uncharacterized protein n=1 Tax=Desulfovibrio subterraneus TaxID=2718620 RepID=A0A7J0BEC2_9BACT|nr:hypothetical protein DSM101010T_04250 [Desulfovibrio subterraneus]
MPIDGNRNAAPEVVFRYVRREDVADRGGKVWLVSAGTGSTDRGGQGMRKQKNALSGACGQGAGNMIRALF